MSLRVRALKNVVSTWGGLAVNISVGFFLDPFILHHQCDDTYGLGVLWSFLTCKRMGIQHRARLFRKASAPGT